MFSNTLQLDFDYMSILECPSQRLCMLLFIKNYYKVMEKNSERGYCIPLFRKTKRIMKTHNLIFVGSCMLYFCLYLCAELQSVDQQAEQQYY